MHLIKSRFQLLPMAKNFPRIALVFSLTMLAACFESPPADLQKSFSCENAPQLRIWRARIADNFAALIQLTNAHDPETADPLPVLKRMRDLHLQLRQYFMNEPIPVCMQEAVRIYVDGLAPLARSGNDKELSAAMQDAQTAVDSFIEAVRTAMPQWAQEAQAAESTPR
ncbi:MAG: hypothetical protein EOO27_03640 [Comamonadaceae bacterium]|nr:MAG: hypothetical protein EOO27_03640 [Comamonadaceae bacterium]